MTITKGKHKCGCCERNSIKVFESNLFTDERKRYICKYCYTTCESLSGLPRCSIERKRIGGYWTQFRGKNKEFIKW